MLSTPNSIFRGRAFPFKSRAFFLAILFNIVLFGLVSGAEPLSAAELTMQPARIVPFAEPDNQPTSFVATVDSSSQITTDWVDSVGTNLPDGYLVLCNTSSTIIPPTDGTTVVDDTSCADGFGAQNIAFGAETAVWSGLDPATTYYFEIYAFIGSGITIDFLTPAVPADG